MAAQLDVRELGASIAEALDRVRRGEEVTISDQGRPIAKIVSCEPKRAPVFDSLKGLIEVGEDFNAPLPEEELQEWEK